MKSKRIQALLWVFLLTLSGMITYVSASTLTIGTDNDLYSWGEDVEFFGTAEPNATISILIVANSTLETVVNSTVSADEDGEYALLLTLPGGANEEIFNVTVSSDGSVASIYFVVVEDDDSTGTQEVTATEELDTNNGKKKGHNKEKGLNAAFNGLNKGKGAKHLYLYEKDPETWEIKEKGAWGKITILPHKDKYIFNAHKLQPDIAYNLINYAPGTDWTEEPDPNPWPGETSVEFGSSTANKGGNIHMKGSWEDDFGGKIWLVLSSDFNDGNGMTAWNPTSYLFEYDLLPEPQG